MDQNHWQSRWYEEGPLSLEGAIGRSSAHPVLGAAYLRLPDRYRQDARMIRPILS